MIPISYRSIIVFTLKHSELIASNLLNRNFQGFFKANGIGNVPSIKPSHGQTIIVGIRIRNDVIFVIIGIS